MWSPAQDEEQGFGHVEVRHGYVLWHLYVRLPNALHAPGDTIGLLGFLV